MTPARRLACDRAWVWLGSDAPAMADRVVLDLLGDRIAAITPAASDFDDVARDPDAHLGGVTIPGLVNAHSHAFHRALRGRTHGGQGTFWTWREEMYRAAQRLDPDRYHRLAVAVFAEMLAAGITCVGEFHYLHHGPGGVPYADPNAMGAALLAAADQAGIRITLLDTLYLTGDVGQQPGEGLSPVQQRFTDGSAADWLARIGPLSSLASDTARVGAALHSVRAVPLGEAAAAVDGLRHADDGRGEPMVLHAHVAEQPAEVDRCREVHGRTPVNVLADAGAVDRRFTAVHGVWLDDADITVLGDAGAGVCACPTTERDLADGVVAAERLLAAGATLSLGSDQHAHTDLLEEARAVELDLRLVTQQRGSVPAEALLDAATVGGAAALGWHDAGRIAVGALADLCTVGWTSIRLAGVPQTPAGLIHSASAADVTRTIVGGRDVVPAADAAGDLSAAITALMEDTGP